MIGTIMNRVRGRGASAWRVVATCTLLLMVCSALPAGAYIDKENPILDLGYNPNGIFIIDGSYVMNVGEVQINITNWGLIGSTYSIARPWSDAPSCQWPAGSGNEYLWSSGLWVGGVMLGERLCSTGGFGSEFYPQPEEVEATIYEAVGTKILRPPGNPDASGNRKPMPNFDDDDDGLVDEEILNGKDDDEDGRIDEDFGQIGNQMFVLTNYDNTRLAQENFPDHTPMNLEVIQTSFQWENDSVDDFVGFDFKINNIGVTSIEKVYVGFFSDSDIGPRGQGGTADDDMAGSWPETHGSPGLVRASDGSFVPLQVGFMYDAAETGRLDGYFGIVFLGHDIDPTGRFAPTRVGMRTFQSFSGNQAFEQGGDPSNDDERYQLLSASIEDWDNDTIQGKQADFRFLVSAGPFAELPPDESLTFQVGMVVGPGLGDAEGGQGLLSNAAEAFLTYQGIWINEITKVPTYDGGELDPGQGGRETMLCKQDFPSGVFDSFKPDYMDTSCVDNTWLLGQPGLTDADRFDYEIDGNVKECAMFNMDNCFECARQLGVVCESAEFETDGHGWDCDDANSANKAPCTGVDGNETQIRWLVGMAPPPPGLRLWAADSRVHVFWDDSSENTEDIRLKVIDFESYRVWRADNWDRPYGSSIINGPESTLWQMISEYDLVNSFVKTRRVDGVTYRDTIPLGANTGLDGIEYEPASLSNPKYDGLADSMQVIVDNDPQGLLTERPEIRDENGVIIPAYQPIVYWESYPDVLDTFFAVAYRAADLTTNPETVEKRSVGYYEYVDYDIHNGFIYFYSVTATDHALNPVADGEEVGLPIDKPGLVGDPGSSFASTQPGTQAQTAEERAKNGVNIYVFPNPATRDALAEYQELFPNNEDPTGVRVTFTNLPMAKNTIQIYTVSGDLVQTISHDGTTGSGHASWNLMSRNGQEIVSGVYLYSVVSDIDQFEDYVGKFVVVR